MKNHKYQIMFLLFLLVFITMSCQMYLGKTKQPENSIPVSVEAAQSLETTIQSAIDEASQTGVLAFTISEEQITSYVTLKLQEQSNLRLTNPQIFLRNSSIQFYSQFEQPYFIVNIYSNINVSASPEGNLMVQVSEADFGPLPVPSDFNSNLENLVNQALSSLIYSQTGGKLFIQSIDIADGFLTLTGFVS